MSGEPSAEGARTVVRLLGFLDQERKELEHASAQLAHWRAAMETAAAKLESTRKALDEELERMDLDAPGNFGWGDRLVWFLGEMRRQMADRL